MYAYRVFEGALAKVFGITDAALPTFRSRLKYFHRLGLTGRSSIAGKNIRYDMDDVFKCGFLIDLYEFGIHPQRISQIALGIWPLVLGELSRSEDVEGDDLFFVALPVMLSAFIVETVQESPHKMSGLTFVGRDGVRYVYSASEIPYLPLKRRTLLINLTSLRSQLRKAVDFLERKT